MEWLTGGYIKAGFHEVVFTEKAAEVLAKNKEEGKSSWRVSSTLFSHIRSEVSIAPLEELKHVHVEGAKDKYYEITSIEKTMEELKAINLHSEASDQ